MKSKLESPLLLLLLLLLVSASLGENAWRAFTRTNFLHDLGKSVTHKNPSFETKIRNKFEEEGIEGGKGQTTFARHFSKSRRVEGRRRLTVNVGDLVS